MEATEVCRAVKFEVTQEDIDNGIEGDCRACPVARAVNRTLPLLDVVVRSLTIVLSGRSSRDRCIIAAPNDVKHFVRAFDASVTACKPAPFSFFLSIPEDVFAWDSSASA